MLTGNLEEARTLLMALLEGAGFSGFSFSTCFCLRFERTKPRVWSGQELPFCVELRLDGDWRFGTTEEWAQALAGGSDPEAPSPDEPLKASLLTKLRWREGSRVDRVELDDSGLLLHFVEGTVVAVPASNDGDWDVVESVYSTGPRRWSVSCEGGAVHSVAPSQT
jgi:hypothetical protein